MFTMAQAKHEIAAAYFLSLVIIGVMFFLNIFLAILLENFEEDNELMKIDAGEGISAKIIKNVSEILSRSGLLKAASTDLPGDSKGP